MWLSIFSISIGVVSVFADMSESHSLDISAVVPSLTPPPGPGSTSSGGSITPGTTVSLSGFSFPNAKLTLLKDGQITTTLIANADGTFQITINDLNFGNFQFSIYAEDPQGVISNPYTVNVPAFKALPYYYTNLIIPPTISSNKLVVKIGTDLSVYGYAAVGSTVNLLIPGSSTLGSAVADSNGFYRVTVPANLAPGVYSLRTNATLGNITSQYSRPIQVSFTNSNEPDQQIPPSQYSLCVDYNHDGRVNLVDFSILLFWFGKNNPPSTIDCNGDRVVDIKDFSILMYFWTG